MPRKYPALRFDRRARLPFLDARPHQNLDVHVRLHPDLATQSKLAEHAVLFKAVVLHLTHRGLLAVELHPASSASSVATASVADVHPVLFKRIDKFCARFDGECAETLGSD